MISKLKWRKDGQKVATFWLKWPQKVEEQISRSHERFQTILNEEGAQ